MKILINVLFSLFLISTSQATITRVQSTSITTTSTNAVTATLTFGANTTVGNTLIIAVASSDRNTVASVVQNVTNYAGSCINGTINTNGVISSVIWYGKILSAGTAIVVTMNQTSAALAMVGVEYSGDNIVLDQTANSTGNSGSPATGTTGTTIVSNELLVGTVGRVGQFSSSQTGWLTSPTNSFSSVLQCSTINNTANNDRAVAFLERIVTSASTYSSGGTATSSQWSGMIATFKECPRSHTSGH